MKQALEEAKPLCDTADVFSEWYYLHGYLYYKQEQVPLADWYFRCSQLHSTQEEIRKKKEGFYMISIQNREEG